MGAELNDDDNPSFLIAVRYCGEEVIRIIWSLKVLMSNAVNSVETEAFEQAIFGERLDTSSDRELGHTVKKYGGAAFRNCLDKRNYDVVDFFIKKASI